jgi:hypothetical protein
MVAWKRRGWITYKVKGKITLELKGFSNEGVGWALGEVERWEKWKNGCSEIGGGWTCRWRIEGKKQSSFVEVKRSLILPNEENFFSYWLVHSM